MLLAEAAQIEVRLRQHILELLEPTIRRQKAVDASVKDVRVSIEKLQEELADLVRANDDVGPLRTQVENFGMQMAQRNREQKELQQTLGDRLSLHETEHNWLRQSLERRQTEMAGLERTVQTLGDSLVAAKEESGQLRQYCTERLDLCRDKTAKLRDEVETRCLSLEEGQHKLKDHQMGTDTEITTNLAHLRRLTLDVTANVEAVNDLHISKASVKCVEQQQQEFQEFSRNLLAQTSSLKQQFGSLISDVKAHFETAAQVVGSTTAKQMDEMRARYQEDTTRVREVVKNIDAFMNEQLENQGTMKSYVSQANEDNKKQIEALRTEFASHSKHREGDCKSLRIECEQLRSCLREVDERMKTYMSMGSAREEAVSLLVEAQSMAACLNAQDDIDRKNIALFGYKGGPAAAAGHEAGKISLLPQIDGVSKATPRRRLAGTHTNHAWGCGTGDGGDGGPILTLDKRCLSCSGSTATVMAGFKMACLEYAPNSVEYDKVVYNRSELIRLQSDLVRTAREQLRAVD